MLGTLQAKQKLNLKSIGLLITSFTVLIVLGRAIVGEVGLITVLNTAWTPEALGAFLFALPLAGYATVGLGVAVFVYYGFRTHFKVDKFAVKKQFKKTFVIASLVCCGLFLSSLVTAPLVSANATATTGYYLATPYSPYDWLVGKYSTGACYAINGSNWANLMTFPATTWAAYADNASKVQELVLAATTAGTVYLKEVAFDYDCTIPENVQVIENVNGLTRTFVDAAESQGSPYTVSVDTVNPTYYTVQDCADRYIISWTSTNKTYVQNSVYTALTASGGSVYFSGVLPDNIVARPSNVQVTGQYQGEPFSFPTGKYPTSWLADSFNGDFSNSSVLNIPLTPMTYVHDLIYDEETEYVWGVTRADANINYVFKVSPDGVITSQALGESGAEKAMHIIKAFGYFWTCTMDSPAHLIKINPNDMSLTTYTMDSGENKGQSLVSDGTYIYMTTNTDPALILKFNPVDNTHTAITATGVYKGYWCTYDGSNVWIIGTYASSVSSYGALGKYNVASGAFTAYTLTGVNGTGEMTFDGRYIWSINQGTSSLVRFDPDALTWKTTSLRNLMRVVEYANGYIWVIGAGDSANRNYLFRVNPISLAMEKYHVVSGVTYAHGFCFDGLNLWNGQWQSPANITRTPAYFSSTGGNSLIVFDGSQELLYPENKSGTPLWVDLNGLTATQSVAQIPLAESLQVKYLSVTISANTFNNVAAFAVYKNDTQVGSTLLITAAATGTYRLEVEDNYFSQGDYLSVKVWAGASSTTGNVTIGKVVVQVFG